MLERKPNPIVVDASWGAKMPAKMCEEKHWIHNWDGGACDDLLGIRRAKSRKALMRAALSEGNRSRAFLEEVAHRRR